MDKPLGGARDATDEEIDNALKPDDRSAINLGRRVRDGKITEKKLPYSGERHVLVLGPNGSGKGTCLLMPNLLQMEGRSIVVLDPKGELAAVTAPFRRTVSKVYILNPFGVLLDEPDFEDLKSDGFNPLRHLDPSLPSFNAEASWLAEALITVEGNDPHWTRSARKLLSALIMHVCMGAKDPLTNTDYPINLSTVRKLLTAPVVAPSKDDPVGRGLPATASDMLNPSLAERRAGTVISSVAALRTKAGQFTRWNREIESIVSTADTQTEPFDDAEIAADLAKPGIDFRDLKKRPTTVYVILPPDMMERHSRWLRLVISSALRGVMRLKKPGEVDVLFMIDEFAALGHLPIIESTWALVRGYGIQMMPVLQDLNQLKSLYKERWETFIGMAGVTFAFGPNDLTTAQWMSDRSGDDTAVISGFSSGTGMAPQGGQSSNQGTNWQQTKLPYLKRHDLFGTKQRHFYAWLAGVANVVRGYAPLYVDIEECEKRSRKNPYFRKDG